VAGFFATWLGSVWSLSTGLGAGKPGAAARVTAAKRHAPPAFPRALADPPGVFFGVVTNVSASR